jgi:hypothetical protein
MVASLMKELFCDVSASLPFLTPFAGRDLFSSSDPFGGFFKDVSTVFTVTVVSLGMLLVKDDDEDETVPFVDGLDDEDVDDVVVFDFDLWSVFWLALDGATDFCCESSGWK